MEATPWCCGPRSSLADKEGCGAVGVVVQREHGMTLFDGGAGYVAPRLLPAQADGKDLAGAEPVKGKAGTHEGHRT